MDLKEYLDSKDISVVEFAKTIGVAAPNVYKWISKKARLTRNNAKKVEEATGGLVTALSMRKRNE